MDFEIRKLKERIVMSEAHARIGISPKELPALANQLAIMKALIVLMEDREQEKSKPQ